MENLTKKCTICKTEKPIGQFYKRSDEWGGLKSDCKQCFKKRAKPHTYAYIYRELDKRATYYINNLIGTNLRWLLKHSSKRSKYEAILGYTLKELRGRLINTMPDGYTWDCFVLGELEIDHIIPRSQYTFSDISDASVRECWAIRNLRLLTKEDNRKKNRTIQGSI